MVGLIGGGGRGVHGDVWVFLETSGVSSGVSNFLWRTGEVQEGLKGVCVCLMVCVCDGDSQPPPRVRF